MGRPVPVRAIIAGGGIGGLSAAIALRGAGVDAVVVEQAPRIAEVGAGVQLAPNGLRQLARLGLGERLAGIMSPFSASSAYRRADGTPAAGVVTSDSSGDLPVGGVHRADLVDALRALLPGDAVRTGRQVSQVSQDAAGATVRYADGTSDRADVVVGADGIHSAVRDAVTAPSPPVFSGTVAYRGLVERRLLRDWPPDRFEVWMGSGSHFLCFPVRRGELVNFVGFVPADDEMRESWSAPGDPDQLRAAFDGWDPRIAGLLSHVERANRWGLYDREPLERWSSGRVTLLGDAAHPMLPHVGQGANQAIEDAALLGALLRGVPADQAGEALGAYQDQRRPRTSAVQAGSRRNGRRYDSEREFTDPGARDADLDATRKFRYWLYDYDVLDGIEYE